MEKKTCNHPVNDRGGDGFCNRRYVKKYSNVEADSYRCREHFFMEQANSLLEEDGDVDLYEVPFSKIDPDVTCSYCVEDGVGGDGSCNAKAATKWTKEFYKNFGEFAPLCREHYFMSVCDYYDNKDNTMCDDGYIPDELSEVNEEKPEVPLGETSDPTSTVGGSGGTQSSSGSSSGGPSSGGGSGNSAPNSPSDDEPPDPQDYARRGEPMPQDPLDPDLCPGRGYKDSHSFISCDNSSGYGCWGGLYNYGQGFCWYCGIPA